MKRNTLLNKMLGIILSATILISSLITVSVTAETTVTPPVEGYVGINLSELKADSAELPFVNLYKMFNPWLESKAVLDENGYPTEIKNGATSCEIYATNANFPVGDYVLIYEGTGDITVKAKATVTSTDKENKKVYFKVTGSGNVGVNISNITPEAYISKITIVKKEYEDSYTNLIDPVFAKNVEMFNTLKFTELMKTNNSTIKNWEDRPLENDAVWTTAGVPVEVMVQMCNDLNKNAWFNIPHLATEDYVKNFATYVKENLNSNLKVYVEYGNELLTLTSTGKTYIEQMGKTLSKEEAPFANKSASAYAIKAVEMIGYLDAVFGDDERLVKVLSSQLQPTISDSVMYTPINGKNACEYADAVAYAEYFGINTWEMYKYETYEDFKAQVEVGLNKLINDGTTGMYQQIEWAKEYGLDILAYEGGSGISTKGYALKDTPDADGKQLNMSAEKQAQYEQWCIDLNNDPEMSQWYKTFLDTWNEITNAPIMLYKLTFKPIKGQSYGLLQSQDQPHDESSKYSAVETWIDENPYKSRYDLTITQPENGSISVSVDGADVATGAVVSDGKTANITATANDGYELVKITANGVEVTNPTNFEITENVEFSAVFQKFQYAISTGTVSNGTITVQETAGEGDTVSVVVTPDAGYQLVEGSLKVGETAIEDGEFEMPAEAVTITAEFAKIDYAVQTDGIENGTVEFNKTTANIGDEITITVTPDAGYELVSGSLKVNGTAITGNKFTMSTENAIVTAEFSAIDYDVTVGSSVTNGSVTVDGDITIANVGDEISLTVTPNEGFIISKILVNGKEVAGTTFTMPAEDVVITAEFKELNTTKYNVTVNVTGNGTVTTDATDAKALEGDTITLTVTPDDRHQLVEGTLKVNGVVVTGNSFIMTDEDVEITAEFEVIKYAVTVKPSTNGTVTVDKSNVAQDETVTITVTPNKGYRVVANSLKVNGEAITGTTFAMPSQAVEITADFELKPLTPEDTYLGTNLSGITPYSSEFPFKDLMKMGKWSADVNVGTLVLDEHGWVKKLGNNNYFRLMYDTMYIPAGDYIMTWEGEGTVKFGGKALNVDVKSNSATFTMSELNYGVQGTKLWIDISDINERNYVKNIKIIETKYADTDVEAEPFQDQFIENFKLFKEFRFMDWMLTNGSTINTWEIDGEFSKEERPQVDDYSWAIKGVPVEIMVQLLNQLDNDGWFCMPHMANDLYMSEFAKYVAQNLEDGRKIYIENSNEAWGGFAAEGWNQGMAAQMGLAVGKDQLTRRCAYYSTRSVEMFKIFENEFKAEGRDYEDDIICVLGTQVANTGTGFAVLDYVLEKANEDLGIENGKKAYEYADAFAIAPYIGGLSKNDLPEWLNKSPDDVLDHLAKLLVDDGEQETRFNAHNIMAAERDLDLICYEAGQHLTAYGLDAYTEMFVEANRLERMGDLYTQYLDQWKNVIGNKMFMFSSTGIPSKWGSWGMLEHQYQDHDEAVKYKAITEWILDNPYDPTLVPSAPTETPKIIVEELTSDKTNLPVKVDGKLTEPQWADGFTSFSKMNAGTTTNTQSFKVIWDENGMYIAVKVEDDKLCTGSANAYQDDSVEIYIDAECDKTATYGANDYQIAKRFGDTEVSINKKNSLPNLQSATGNVEGTYIYEFFIAWEDLKVTPSEGLKVGVDIGANDDDGNGGEPDAKVIWSGDGDNWRSTQRFGDVTLGALGVIDPSLLPAITEETKVPVKDEDVTENILPSIPVEFYGLEEAVFPQGVVEDLSISLLLKQIKAQGSDEIAFLLNAQQTVEGVTTDIDRDSINGDVTVKVYVDSATTSKNLKVVEYLLSGYTKESVVEVKSNDKGKYIEFTATDFLRFEVVPTDEDTTDKEPALPTPTVGEEAIDPEFDENLAQDDKVLALPVEFEGLADAVFGDGKVPADTIVSILVKQLKTATDNGTLVFDIKPIMTVDGVTTVIGNDLIDGDITIKLYLNDSIESEKVKVVHFKEDETTSTFQAKVNSDTNGKYILMTVSEFSRFEISPVEEATGPATGDSSTLPVVTAIMLASAMTALFVLRKKARQ